MIVIFHDVTVKLGISSPKILSRFDFHTLHSQKFLAFDRDERKTFSFSVLRQKGHLKSIYLSRVKL